MRILVASLLLFSQVASAVTPNKVWRVAPGASIPSWGPVNLADSTNAITGAFSSRAHLPTVGEQYSGTVSNSNSTASYIDFGSSVSLVTTGRPVFITLQPNGTTPCIANISMNTLTGSLNGDYQLVRGTTSLGEYRIAISKSSNWDAGTAKAVPISIAYLDSVSAGTYSWKIQGKSNGSQTSFGMSGCKLSAHEL